MIHFSAESGYNKLKIEKLLTRAAEAALAYLGEEMSDLSLVIMGDKKMRRLNKQFRGINQPTDVLSFPAGSPMMNGAGYLGDIVISLPRARHQASAAGHSLNDELQLLVVHGVLHLLGHDHDTPNRKKKMWAVQDEILRNLGVRIDVDNAVTARPSS